MLFCYVADWPWFKGGNQWLTKNQYLIYKENRRLQKLQKMVEVQINLGQQNEDNQEDQAKNNSFNESLLEDL